MRTKSSFRESGGSLVGGSSLLTIFAVLCLTVFALLSLNTAQAGERLSRISADSIAAYYRAEAEAEEILAELRSGKTPAGVTVEDDICRYTCSVSETQVLEVAVQLEKTGEYTILRWQSMSVTDWQPDTDLTVWDGDTAK